MYGYYINLQVDRGGNMGMYNGVTSRHSILIHTNLGVNL